MAGSRMTHIDSASAPPPADPERRRQGDAEVEILLFGRLRQAAGVDRHVLPLAEGATVAELWSQAEHRWPQLGPARHSVRPAVNECFAGWDEQLRAGDRVAFLPPVSGG